MFFCERIMAFVVPSECVFHLRWLKEVAHGFYVCCSFFPNLSSIVLSAAQLCCFGFFCFLLPGLAQWVLFGTDFGHDLDIPWLDTT